MHRFTVELADIDRGVYETLELRVARHPSEDLERLVVRLLARAIGHEPRLEFGRGLSTVEDPALWSRADSGQIETWIDVGVPSAERLHRASKRADTVRVFTHKPTSALVREWTGRRIHRGESLEIVEIPAGFVRDLAAHVDRTNRWFLTVQEGMISVTDGSWNVQGTMHARPLTEFLADRS